MIHNQTQIPIDSLKLLVNDAAVTAADSTLLTDVLGGSKRIVVDQRKPMELVVMFPLNKGEKFVYKCPDIRTATVGDFKAAIQERYGFSPEFQRLLYKGRPITDHTQKIGDIEDFSKLCTLFHIVWRVNGG